MLRLRDNLTAHPYALAEFIMTTRGSSHAALEHCSLNFSLLYSVKNGLIRVKESGFEGQLFPGWFSASTANPIQTQHHNPVKIR